MQWLHLEVLTKDQIREVVMVEHNTIVLPFKRKTWVLCHQPGTLEEAISLMEVYASAETGLYLIPKAWKKKASEANTSSKNGGEKNSLAA